MPGGSWSSSFIWGRKYSTVTNRSSNSYLVESVLPIRRKNIITGRIEVVDKDELFRKQPELEERPNSLYGDTFREGAYTIGYTRDIDVFKNVDGLRNVQMGVGANLEMYSLPGAINPYYGDHPVGGNIFVRFRLRPHT